MIKGANPSTLPLSGIAQGCFICALRSGENLDEKKTPRSFERGAWSSKYFRTSLHAPAIAGINGRNDEGEVLNHCHYFMRGEGGVNNFREKKHVMVSLPNHISLLSIL